MSRQAIARSFLGILAPICFLVLAAKVDWIFHHAPPRLAFAPGPVPEPLEPAGMEAAAAPREPGPEHVAQADSLVRVIRDEDLRKVVAKAAALSLANAPDDRSFW